MNILIQFLSFWWLLVTVQCLSISLTVVISCSYCTMPFNFSHCRHLLQLLYNAFQFLSMSSPPAVTVQCLSLSLSVIASCSYCTMPFNFSQCRHLLQLLYNAFQFLSMSSHLLLTEQFFLLICFHPNFHILLHLWKIFPYKFALILPCTKRDFLACFFLFSANFVISCVCSTFFPRTFAFTCCKFQYLQTSLNSSTDIFALTFCNSNLLRSVNSHNSVFIIISIFHSILCLPLHPFNPLNAELNPICCLLALLGAHHFLHVSRIRVKLLTLRWLMPYIYMTLVT